MSPELKDVLNVEPAPVAVWKARLAILAAILLPMVAGWLFFGDGLSSIRSVQEKKLPGEIGEPAPDFSLENAAGPSVQLSGLRGQVVLVNFWATWCVPCLAEMADIQSVYQTLGPRGFRVLAINVQESAADVQPFMGSLGLTFPALLDRDFSVGRLYRTRGLPSSYLVDRQGIVRYVRVGPMTREDLEGEVLKVL